LLLDRALTRNMAAAAREVARRWTAEKVADTLVRRLQVDGILRE
jgi:hypothetical protein